jgi:hypothetical protein
VRLDRADAVEHKLQFAVLAVGGAAKRNKKKQTAKYES